MPGWLRALVWAATSHAEERLDAGAEEVVHNHRVNDEGDNVRQRMGANKGDEREDEPDSIEDDGEIPHPRPALE